MRYLIIILALNMYSSYSICSNQLYITTDQYGNKVYSDKKPKSGTYETKQQRKISTVTWEKTKAYPKSKISNKKRKKHLKTKLTKKQFCMQLSDKMNLLDKQLQYKQKASQFDLFKKKLRDTRWQYQTKC